MPTKERFAEIIGSGIWNCTGKWVLNGSTWSAPFAVPGRCTPRNRDNLSTHDTLRKPSLGGHDYRKLYRDGRFELISSPCKHGEQVSTGGSIRSGHPCAPTLTTSTNPDEGTVTPKLELPATETTRIQLAIFQLKPVAAPAHGVASQSSLSTPQPRPNPATEAARAAETVAGR